MGLTERSFLERMELMGFTPTRAATNADLIRSMSDEELAHFLEMKAGRFVSFYPTQAKSWLDWLRQESPHDQP